MRRTPGSLVDPLRILALNDIFICLSHTCICTRTYANSCLYINGTKKCIVVYWIGESHNRCFHFAYIVAFLLQWKMWKQTIRKMTILFCMENHCAVAGVRTREKLMRIPHTIDIEIRFQYINNRGVTPPEISCGIW